MLTCSGKARDYRPSIGLLQKHLQFSTCPNDSLHKVLHRAAEQQGFMYSAAHPIRQAMRVDSCLADLGGCTVHKAPLLSSPVQHLLQQCCQDLQMSDTAVA